MGKHFTDTAQPVCMSMAGDLAGNFPASAVPCLVFAKVSAHGLTTGFHENPMQWMRTRYSK